MKFKISEKAKVEFEFYLNSSLDMVGRSIGDVGLESSNSGHSALECWWALDTHGKTVPCRELDVLSKVMRSKKSVNLQVRLWAEDIADGMLLRQSELLDYTHKWPEWVFRATMEQAAKLLRKTIGFVPRFARAEYLCGTLWPPHMDSFDPSI